MQCCSDSNKKLFMKQSFFLLQLLFILASGILFYSSCSKGGGNTPPPANPCSGVTVVVNGTVANPTATGASDGSISVTATGGSGFTFSLNNGAFQSSATFSGLAAGAYTVTAKNSNGCTGSANFTLTAANPCSGVTITVNATVSNPTAPGSTNGSIAATANGGTGPYTYSLNGGAFQSSNVFSNLNTGVYAVTAKDVNGCAGTSSNSVVSSLPAGPLFSAVKNVLQANCVTCHNASTPNGGMDWTIDCNIVNNRERIKARAVDANPSAMPPTGLLPASERQKITDWINAGGRYTD